jgi:trk system potassium uptake protein TrkA
VEYPYTFDVVEFENGRVLLIGIQIDENSPVLGKNLAEIADKFDEFTFRIVAINRAGSTIIPRGSESIKENDRLYVIAKGDKKDEVFKLAVEEVYANRNIMILGGGKIGQMVAERLDDIKHISVKMIESNEEKSEMLAGKLQNTLVVVGDGTDIDLLAQEGIQEHDMFIALTSNDETNIVSSLVAKHLRVKRTVTLIGREDYLPLTKTIGLDLAINARLIASNAILRFVRRGSVKTMCSLKGIEAEAFEFEISEKCKACDKTLKELSLPEGIIIGTILRKNEVIIPVGGTAIRPGDRVIVFCLPQLVGQVEKLFV